MNEDLFGQTNQQRFGTVGRQCYLFIRPETFGRRRRRFEQAAPWCVAALIICMHGWKL